MVKNPAAGKLSCSGTERTLFSLLASFSFPVPKLGRTSHCTLLSDSSFLPGIYFYLLPLPYIPLVSSSYTRRLIHFPDCYLAPGKALRPCHEARNGPGFLLNKKIPFIRTTKRQSWQTTAFGFSWDEITITAF